ncbi:hypothetical protein QYM36_010489 [Artemia franciscana]|uniref:Ionotropic glutamate receptor L-glutamate and glycine-binding domain-containing protein n=1 Tax=Artemia franciscana TaxID=6661 RepID=A0AA88L427_ARTSF|nr:hypothetical protein QYM36_010489 [Artemia franciscana]
MIKWTQLTVFVLANISFLCTVNGLPRHIKIGALFLEEQKGSAVELAFKYAVYKVNKDPDLLPNSSIHYDIEYVKLEDSFHTSKKVCRQIRNGVHAILGPSDPFLGSHVQSVCDALDIPHLDARLDINSEKKEFSINIYPAPNSLNKAFQDIMDFFNWTKVAIIYEDDYGLIKLQDLVRTPGPFNREVFFQQASSGSFLEILKDIKTREHYNIVVDISNGPSLKEFLRGVLKLHMNDYKYHYLFTTFDAETYDLEEFNYNFVNITSFRLVDSEHFRTIQIFKDMERFQTAGSALMNKSRILQAESAMIIDAVYTFALALQALDRGALLRRTNISCADEEPWADGSSLFNYINSVEYRGLTGPIQFKEGQRVNFKLDLLKLKAHEFVKVGEWTLDNGINITDHTALYDHGNMNVTLVVTTNQEVPYIFMHHGKNYTGNNRFYGFCVELLDEIAKLVGFSYILELNPDGVYGVAHPVTGEWNGIVKQLMNHEVPFVMIRSDGNFTGNDRYEGFCIDVLKEIAEMVNFNFTIKEGHDGWYGIYNPESKKWNGLVLELIQKVFVHL